MKVLVIGHSLSGGGAEFVTREWIKYLHEAGDEVAVVLLDGDAKRLEDLNGSIPQTLLAEFGATHHDRARALRKTIGQVAPDVCLAMQTYPALMTLIATRYMARAPRVIISERNMPSLLLKSEGRAKKVQYALARRLYRHADAVVAISHPVAADLVAALRVPPERCFVVPNPASAKSASRPALSPTPSISPQGTRIVLTLPFRLAPQKRPLLAVETAKELESRGHEVALHFYGRGPLEPTVRAQSAEHGVNAEFFGWREDWFSDAANGSVVLLPSHCEGFGNVLVEAASVGLASVAWSGALGVADAIIPGVTGEFALSDSPSGYADAIERASQMRVVPPRGWIEHFSPGVSGKKIRAVLQYAQTKPPSEVRSAR